MVKRNTAAKQRIQQLLEESGSAMSQDVLEEQLKGEFNRVTIYRVLNSFLEDGLVHRVVGDEGKAYFAICRNCKKNAHRHEHVHFKCLNCEKVECLPGQVKIKLPEGYVAETVNYYISGYCADCR